MLAQYAFPASTEDICTGIEEILMREPAESASWLQTHSDVNYLLRVESVRDAHEAAYPEVFLKYQALVFGFYYTLLSQLLSLDLVEPNAYFHGIWGSQSTTFLAMCTQLGQSLRRSDKASRAHILFVLAAMYNGRRKVFNPESPMPRLVGVIGPISVLALPLFRTTDVPEEIWKIAVVDLPIVDLSADNSDGELMASGGGGLRFISASETGRDPKEIESRSSTAKWTVHPHMAISLGRDSVSGVVMAARCGSRLVGWFNPLAADISFLGSAYSKGPHCEDGGAVKREVFEVRDEDWQASKVPRPDTEKEGYQFGVVLSNNSPALRYAAAGFYGERGEEITIARSKTELYAAFDRLQAAEQGVVIA
jgi:hypothetical protein